MTALLALLLAAPAAVSPLGPLPFGVPLGARPAAVRAAFAPQGQGVDTGRWAEAKEGEHVLHVAWRCDAKARCFATPDAADFWFVRGRLAAATLHVDPDRAAPGKPAIAILLEQEGVARLGQADARVDAAGRRVRYYVREGKTVVWAQDGRQTQIKLYDDARHPVGRAESVAAGARPQGLETLPGGKAWAAGQLALNAGDWNSAVARFDEIQADRKVSPLARAEARVLLALCLAARARHTATRDRAAALADLDRARALAPDLKADLDALQARFGSK